MSVQGGFAAASYVANSTTVDRGDGPKPEPDASSPLLHGIRIGELRGRSQPSEPEDNRRVVIRQRLTGADFQGDFVLRTAEGTTLRMNAAGEVERSLSGDARRGLTAQDLRVVRSVEAAEDGGVWVTYTIINAGIDERGIPGVRLGTVEGILIETDAFGRYHLEGIDVSHIGRGRNFLVKVDESTLPAGSVFTTDNPQLRRITQGLPVRFDFGVQVPETVIDAPDVTVEIELGEVLFEPGSARLRSQYGAAIQAMAARLAGRDGEVTLTGYGEDAPLALARVENLRDALLERLSPEDRQNLRVSLVTQSGLALSLTDGGVLFGQVLFDTDSAVIKPEHKPLLQRLAALLEARGDSAGLIEITGHADRRASASYNLALGLRRAQAVMDALSSEMSEAARARLRVHRASDVMEKEAANDSVSASERRAAP